MFYILTPIFLGVMACFPLVVPKYLSQTAFLLGYLLLVLIVSVTVKIYFYVKKKH